jgi:hypothetical protein
MSTNELAEEFYNLFAGLDRAHGQFNVKREEGKGKVGGSAKTHYSPPSVELWKKHLEGNYGLGVVPIRDDGTVRFGAIDVDDYSVDISQIERDLRQMNLPLVPCRTKSGGVHLYLFCSEDVDAELVRSKLMDWSVALGHSGVEIFPKQARLSGNQGDVGNWINMPYHCGDRTVRYAVREGDFVPLSEFPAYARQMSVTAEELAETNPPENEQLSDILYEAPPCLQTLAKRGFPEGTRNNGLFNVAVYLRKRYGDGWQDKIDEYNQRFMDPPLGHKEVQQITKSAGRKDYQFTCSQSPIAQVCNKQICLTREYGVGGADDDPDVAFDTMTILKTEPPIYIWSVNGKRIEFNSQELMDQRRVHKRCMDELFVWPKPIKPKAWQKLVQKAMDNAEVVDVPPDATMEGQLWHHLEAFCTGRATARNRDELLLGKPWFNPDDSRHYFRSYDFLRYLEQQRVRGINERRLWAWLSREGATHHFFNIKGKGVNCWSVPAFPEQNESYDVPEPDEDQTF